MNSKEANSKAQSSFDSQKTRATACSKEAELKADLLIELYPQFEFKVEEFPEKVRKHNQGIFNGWKGLFKTIDKCTDWTPLLRNQLNLRLQNLPRENGMFQVVLRMIFLTIYSNGSIERAIRQLFNANQAAAE